MMAQGRLAAWFAVALGISAVLLALTALHPVLQGQGPAGALAAKLRLTVENNPGSWWASMLLALAAVQALDGQALWRDRAPGAARGWTLVGLLCLALSADEMGSAHERLILGDMRLLLGAAGLAGLAVLVRALTLLHAAGGAERRAAVKIGTAVLLFATVPVQEYLEPMFDGASPIVQGVRAVLEEGIEMVGILLLLHAGMANSARLAETGAPPFVAPTAYRQFLTAAALFLAPSAAALTGWLAGLDNSGHPADWLAAALFLGAMLLPVRGLLDGTAGPADLGLAALLLLGSGAVSLDPAPVSLLPVGNALSPRLALMLVVTVAAISLAAVRWRGPTEPLSIGAAGAAALALLPFVAPPSAFLQFLAPPLLAVAVFAVIAAREIAAREAPASGRKSPPAEMAHTKNPHPG